MSLDKTNKDKPKNSLNWFFTIFIMFVLTGALFSFALWATDRGLKTRGGFNNYFVSHDDVPGDVPLFRCP